MSFSLSARKIVACWCSLVAVPAVVFGQGSFGTGGGEYSITGRLPGDQVYPSISFTTNGGYITWQDNWIDGDGLGVGAMRLENNLTSSGIPFRVNSLVAGDQENAQVCVLNNGGAAFTWQGGRQGLQHIYARFLSPSNYWVTGDVMVNSSTNCYQNSPVIATLLNGNVVVAYSSLNQVAPGSMMDVYFQMFSASGNKIGGETLVNQFTPKNQRSPAIAALANGSFAIAWVSEQERWTDVSNGVPSVDIDARIFNNDGTAAATPSGEFLINVSSNLCAYPALAAAPDGGFMATWMEKDLLVLNNSWDIYSRRFPPNSSLGGNVTRVNTQLYGDQYSPKIQSAGATYLDVWTSLGQDGSREGVFGTFLNDDGTTSGSELQVNTTTKGSQMEQAIASDGAGRFLVSWTMLGGPGVDGFDLFGQQYINPAVASVGINNNIFNSDPNANPNSVSNPPPITPLVLPPPPPPTNPPVAITNTFSQVKGVYNGLVYDPNGITSANSGYITITTTTGGGFTAKLQLGGASYSFSGQFSYPSGTNSAKAGPWTVGLLLDLQGGYQITGQVSNGGTNLNLQAYLDVYNKTNLTALNGAYTMVVQSGNGTMGNGIGTLNVDTLGNVQCNLTLPDGATLSQKTTLSKGGVWPLYGTPYKNGGVVIGWVQFNGASSNGFSGQCVWAKPGGAGAPYTGGVTNAITISGSAYVVPPLAYRAFGNAQIVFSGGGLTSPITNSVTWSPLDNKIVNHGANQMSLSLTPKTGLFKGTVVQSGHSVPFQGVLLENNNVGLGFFPGGNLSGGVSFAPNP